VNRFASLCLVALVGSGSAASQEAPARESGDYNFDGHLDYRVPAESPGNQCGWWSYFIFDAESGEHRAVETAFCKEEFDAVDKLVKTRVSGGMAGYVYAVRHFRWEGLKLVPVFAETQAYDQRLDLFIRTTVTNLEGISGPTVSSELLTRDEVTAEFESIR
jgi:hypothetical protein